MIPKISLEQWLAFKTVVESGSYVLAAEQLNKSQSSISYAIARLSEQLPQPVLKVQGRKAELTVEGEVLYRHATQLIKLAQNMEDVARAMAIDFESEVTVALDVLMEISAISRSLAVFSDQFPHTRVRVLETSMTGTIEALIEKQANIVIGSKVPVGFKGEPLQSVKMIPVACPDHPIFKLQSIREFELKGYRQIVLRDSGRRKQIDAGWLEAEQRWTVSHFSSSVSLLKSGLAFAFVPANWIVQELKQGILKEIDLAGNYSRTIPMYLMLSATDSSGPATRALAALISNDLN